jgi:methionyl-tRNA formyltransferase
LLHNFEKMKLLVAATGDIALPLWDWLMGQEHQVIGLLTQPDKPQGRKMIVTPPVIKERAIAAGIPVMQPESLRKKVVIDEFVALAPDLIIVMAYGQMLPTRFIESGRLGCVNLHASLLPKYRGAACIPAAIGNGDHETGVTLMHVVKEMDAGDMITRLAIPIAAEDTGGSLHDKLALLAPLVLEQAMASLLFGGAKREPQELADVSHVGKITREHGRIDWTRSALEIERLIRAMDPWPGTYSQTCFGQRLKIFPFCRVVEGNLPPGELAVLDGELCVGTGQGVLSLGELQPEGGKRMPAMAYARGMRDGTSLVS